MTLASVPAGDPTPDNASPPGLDDEGLAFFTAMNADLDALNLEPDGRELALIVQTARQITHVNALSAALQESGILVQGSKAQPVANPLVASIARAREVLNSLLHRAKAIVPAENESARAVNRRSLGARYQNSAATRLEA